MCFCCLHSKYNQKSHSCQVSKYYPSLEERKRYILEDGCAACGGMSVGDGGFSGAADPEGPVAGYDPLMGAVNRVRRKRKKK